MRKVDKILAIFSRVLSSPYNKISQDEIEKLSGSDKTMYRIIQDLTAFTIDDEPIFRKVSKGNKKYLVLNKSMFKYFIPEHLDTAFIFETYRKIGSLIKSPNFDEDVKMLKSDVFKLNGHAEEFDRKFYYLDKVTRKESDAAEEARLSKIISSLIANQKMHLNYNGKEYSKVLPLSLIQYRDALYLMISKDSKLEHIRTLKLNRLEDVEVLEETFNYPKKTSWSPEDEFNGSSGIISGESSSATIRVYDQSRIHVSEKSFFNKTLKDTNANYDEYEITYTCEDELLGQLFVYAQDVEIVSPQSLSERFYEKALSALNRNQIKKAS